MAGTQTAAQTNKSNRLWWTALLAGIPIIGLCCFGVLLLFQNRTDTQESEIIPVNLHSPLEADYFISSNPDSISGIRLDLIWDVIHDREPGVNNLEARQTALENSLLTPVAAVASALTTCRGVHVLYPDQTMWVASTQPNMLHTAGTHLELERSGGQVKRILLHFPLQTSFSQYTQVQSVHLELDVAQTTGTLSPNHLILSGPDLPVIAFASHQLTAGSRSRSVKTITQNTHTWDVTDIVNNWFIRPSHNNGLLLEPGPANDFAVLYYSLEFVKQDNSLDFPNAPRLIINCDGQPQPIPIAQVNTPTPTIVPPSPTPQNPTATVAEPALQPTPGQTPLASPPAAPSPTVPDVPSPTVPAPVPTVTPPPALTSTPLPPPTPTPDPDDGDGDGGDPPTPTPTPFGADLSVTKTANTTIPFLADPITFTITIKNDGPEDTANVELSDALPAGLTYVSSTAGQGSYNSGSGIWTVGTLTSGQSVNLTLVATVTSLTSMVNTAQIIASDATDPDSTPNNGVEAEDDQSSVTITPTLPRLAINDITVSESAGTAVFSVTLSAPSNLPVSVTYSSADGTALNGQDYTGQFAQIINFPPGSTLQTISINLIDDAVDEDDETFFINLFTPVNATFSDSQGMATIIDDDPPPALSIADTTVTEGDPPAVTGAVFTVTLSAVSQKTVTVNYAAGDTTATNGPDYTLSPGTLTFSPGVTTQFVTANVLGDLIDENDETFTVNLTGQTNATIADGAGIGTIIDDDILADMSISKQASAATMLSGQPLTYTITITHNGVSDAQNVLVTDTLPLSVTITGVSPATSTQVGQNLGWNFGTVTSGTVQNMVVQVTVDSAFSGTLVNNVQVTNTISDPVPANNTAGQSTTVTLPIADLSVSKAVNNSTPALGQAITFTVTVNNAGPQSATNVLVQDALPAGLGYVSDTPGQGSYNNGSGIWTVGTLNSGQTVNLTLVATPTVGTLITNTALVTASDQLDPDSTPGNTIAGEDDQADAVISPTLPSLSINDVTVTEGDSGMVTATFRVSMSTTSLVPVLVNYATADNNATSPADYNAASGTLTFPPGTTVQTFTVQINGDTTDETTETYTATLTNAVNATLADADGLGTIIDDDNPELSINDISVLEGLSGNTAAVFTVTLSAAGVETATVNYATANGTATIANSDYTFASGTLTFAPGITQQTLTIQVTGDAAFESDETFYVSLTSPSNATLADGLGVGAIVNDDSGTLCSSPTITLTDATADTYITSNQPNTVRGLQPDLQVKPDTAPQEWKTLIAFDTSAIPANSSVSCAQLLLNTVITDTLQTIFVHQLLTSWVETEATWNERSTGNAWTPSGGGSGTDYASSATTSFVADTVGLKVVNITSLAQNWVSNPGTNFGLILRSTGGNGAAGFDSRESGGVIPRLLVSYQPTFSINDTSVSEGDSGSTSAVFTITLTSALTQTATVDYTTSDNTATTANNDYVAAAGTATFAAGVTQQTITITVNGDINHESDETFAIYLSNPTNAAISDGEGVGTILNDEIGGTLFRSGNRTIFLPIIVK